MLIFQIMFKLWLERWLSGRDHLLDRHEDLSMDPSTSVKIWVWSPMPGTFQCCGRRVPGVYLAATLTSVSMSRE